MLLELFLSILIISLVSLIGAFTLGFNPKKLEYWLEGMVAFAIGALLGDVFIHLMPEIASNGFGLNASLSILSGIVAFFVLEKIIHWHHCHHVEHNHPHSRLTSMTLFADGIHNLIDGIILAGAFLTGPIVGFSTAIAVLLHEIPQELGHYGILLKGGFTPKRALAFNFITALTAFLGAILALVFSSLIQGATFFIIAFAAGSFLYLAGTDLFPELHREYSTKKAIMQLFFILLGIGIMCLLLLIG